jgi:hypothetical protein
METQDTDKQWRHPPHNPTYITLNNLGKPWDNAGINRRRTGIPKDSSICSTYELNFQNYYKPLFHVVYLIV